MAIRGNNSLIVNPILVPISNYHTLKKEWTAQTYLASPEEAWEYALSHWNELSWEAHALADMYLEGLMYRYYDTYMAQIKAWKSRLTVDLSSYSSNDYLSADLVVSPRRRPDAPNYHEYYYNEQGWIENKWNFLKDVKGELGTVWISEDYYASSYTPLIAPTPPHNEWAVKGWETGSIRIALIPKT